MTGAITVTSIVTLLQGGTYPIGALPTTSIYDYPQPELRRRYPSCEVVIDTPESTESTQKATNTTYGFKIIYYNKILGAGSTTVANQKSVEDQIKSIMESATLEDPNIILETKSWSRQIVQAHGTVPRYAMSTLTVRVRNILISNRPSNALLTFDLSNSSVTNPPAGNYTYTEVYDASIIYGYNSVDELVTTNPIGDGVPIRFRGKFSGRVIFNIYVKPNDFGSTGDKLNKINTLLSGGEKPEVGLIFQAYDASSPTRHTISTTFRINIDEIQQIANFNDNQVFRIIGTITRPPTITSI